MRGAYGNITLNNNGNVLFTGNLSAIYCADNNNVTLSNNGNVLFTRNSVSSGVIYGYQNFSFTLSKNGSVTFSENAGGAIRGWNGTLTISENVSVTVCGNSSSGSSAISLSSSELKMCDNGSITFSGNLARDNSMYSCGAISVDSGNFAINNNDSVLFEKNVLKSDSGYRMRSIYMRTYNKSSVDVLSLSSAEDKSIEFRDAVYIGNRIEVNLNRDYTDASGVTHKQKGDIVFTGKYTEAHLNEWLESNGVGRTATMEEIISSCTSEIRSLTKLYGGSLRVEDGAIYRGCGITAMADSESTVKVKDASLLHGGYDLTFHAGTSLELMGDYTLCGNVQMLDNSALAIEVAQGKANYILGEMNLGKNVDFTLTLPDSLSEENTILLFVSGGVTGWNEANITLNGGYVEADKLQYVDGFLLWNYNAETFNRYFNGASIHANREIGDMSLLHYEKVSFEHISTSGYEKVYGGAVYADKYSCIELSGNESVTFSGNAANATSSSTNSGAYGGAIYGNSESSIILIGNESVTFSGNAANATSSSAHSSSAYGGAIYGESHVVLSGNGSVSFSGNAVNDKSASQSNVFACGGAIYVSWMGDLVLSSNDCVEFIENTAISEGGAIAAYGAITISDNDSIEFIDNSARYGGAIAYHDGGDLSLSRNQLVRFRGNQATGAYGGAIYGGSFGLFTLSDNGCVEFSGNTASSSSYSASGGAIYTKYDLSIHNNDSVEFFQNAEMCDGIYRLRSIYAAGWPDDSVISFSAAGGKNIIFRDSIYVGGGIFNLNADYTNAEGKVIKQKGDILFTGGTTVDDLYTVKGNVAGTEAEIQASRTSEVCTITNLYGGRLRVEEGAIYQGYGITAHAGSASTVRVKDAMLSHEGYDLIFNAGTTLELEGTNSIYGNLQLLAGSTLRLQDATLDSSLFASTVNAGVTLEMAGVNTITGNLQMQDDSTLRFIYATDTTLSMTGNLNFDGSVTIELVGYGEGNYELISQNGGMLSGWDSVRFVDGSGNSLDALRFIWQDNSLYYVNGEAQNFIWTNATGDGMWNNVSENWEADGASYASAIMQNVVFASGGKETITMVDKQTVNSLTVQENGQYVLTESTGRANLTVRGNVTLEEKSAFTIQGDLDASAINGRGAIVVTGSLDVAGGMTAASLQAGSLTADSLTLTDAAATNTIGSSVSLVGAVNVAGSLNIDGSLTAASLQAASLTVNALTLTDATVTNAVSGNAAVNGALKTAGVLNVGGTLKAGALAGGGNKLNVGGDIVLSGITGDSNVLDSGAKITTGAVNGSYNTITAVTEISTNKLSLTGSYNTLESTAGQVFVQGTLQGDHNTLKGGKAPSDGNTISVWSGIRGSHNVLLAEEGNIAMGGGALQGNSNSLTSASGAVTTGAISGDANALSAGLYVNIKGRIVGDGNEIASSGIEAGNGNGIRIAQGLEGDGNKLTAEAGRIVIGGTSSLNGSNNALIAKGATTGGEAITFDGNMSGSGNTLTAEMGNIRLGSIGGDANTLTAGNGNIVAGSISGTGNVLTGAAVNVGALSGAVLEITGKGGINAADVAIDIDTLSATNSSIEVVNNGSINIDTLNAQTGSGDTGTTITTHAGNVSIGVLNTTARNTIDVGSSYGLSVGSGSASNQTWTAGSLSVTGAAGLALTDSMVTVTGVVESSALSLAGETALTADTVSVNSVSMTSGASITGSVYSAEALSVSGGVIHGAVTAGAAVLDAVSVDSALTTVNATVKNAVTLGAADVTNLQLLAGATLDVGGVLSAGTITLQQLSAASPALTVGQFGAGGTVFQLDVDTLNTLNLGHGESVTIARADQTIGGGFTAWLISAGSTSLDAGVYRYDISVENTDVVVTLDYANWGTRVWYGNTWEGMENWDDYMVCGYDAVDGVETVDLGGAGYEGSYLLVAPGKDSSTTVFRNGDLVFEAAEIADSRVELASDASLEVYGNLEASGKEVTLHGSMELMDAQIGALSGTSGTLTIVEDGMVSIGSNVTLGKLQNNGTLDIGKNKLNVAGAVTTGGNVTAGEVVVHNRANSPAKFNALVADKVTVTNTLSNYEDAISLGDGSAVGELHTEKLEVREGTVTLGYADKATQQTVQNLDVKKSASLVLNQQTELSVSNSLTAAENSTVQLKQDAALNYKELSISNKHADKTVSVNAAQLAANSSELVLQDAHVKTTGSGTYELGYQLVNSSVENAGSGTLQVTNGNNTLSGVVAGGGSVEIFNADSGMTMEELQVAAGLSVSVMVGASGTSSANAEVVVTGSSMLGGNSALNADLTLAEGATLDMNSLESGAVLLNGTLSIGGQIIMGENLLATLNEKPGEARSVTIFTGLDAVDMSAVTGSSTSNRVWAGVIFSNMSGSYCYLNYVAETGSLVAEIVPEPATATLSLLALAALAARRRRK